MGMIIYFIGFDHQVTGRWLAEIATWLPATIRQNRPKHLVDELMVYDVLEPMFTDASLVNSNRQEKRAGGQCSDVPRYTEGSTTFYLEETI